jgi:hypothetical protein
MPELCGGSEDVLKSTTELAAPCIPGLSYQGTEQVLRALIDARLVRRRELHAELVSTAEPQDVLRAALNGYRNNAGEDWLIAGALVLRDMGARAWPVLLDFVRSDAPDSEQFVRAIVRNAAVPVEQRTQLLEEVARSSRRREMRVELMEAALELPTPWRGRVLRALAAGFDDIASDARLTQ